MKWREIKSAYKSRIEQLESLSPRELLEVSDDALKEEIRAAYLRKLKVHHPDKNDAFMKEYANRYSLIINAAYEKLMEELG
ncbi:J domain-containing protein [Minwuia sp. IMCC3060]|jgi:curved DNA-binding protein CbpA|uniref:J domain-containing protein n=1 Tax=Minwuia sp. IMCC3060 TaxID=3040675 RepID=UPI002478B72C|nr:J domain-containing protein [Minwuia sp. IMCC3060]